MDFTLFEAMPGVNLLLLPDAPRFTIVTVSNDFIKISGMQREAVVGKSLFDVFPESPDDPNFVGERNLRASFEYVLQHKDRHQTPLFRYDIPNGQGGFIKKYWRTNCLPVLDKEGVVQYIIESGEELTAQVLAEQRDNDFKALEKNFNLFMQAPVAVCMVNGPDFIVEVANEGMLNILGRTSSMIGRPIVESLTEAKLQGLIGILEGVRQTGETYKVSAFPATLLINGIREQRYFDLVIKPYYPTEIDAEVSSIFCVAHNVTELVQAKKRTEESEQSLYAVVEGAPFPIAVYEGEEMRIKIANKAMIAALGKGPNVIGQLHKDVMLELDPQVHQKLKEVYQTGIPYYSDNEQVDIIVDGQLQTYYYTYSFIPLHNIHGQVYGVLNTAVDVTAINVAHKQIEQNEAVLQKRIAERTQELENLNLELKRSNGNLEEFAYAASHDMKEPIRKIHFFASRLREQLEASLTQDQKHLFGRMEHAAQRMNSLIDDLLTYSHFSKAITQMEPVDLNEKVKTVLEDLELEIEEKKAIVTIDPLPTINGHKRQLQQLFQNLIGNALKYCKPGVQPEVRVSCRHIADTEIGLPIKMAFSDKNYCLIEVKDNGIGFSPEDAERIFNVFTRLHGKAEYSGTGIGLSIAQKVVDNHGGSIWADAQPNEGASFKVLLPTT